MPIGHYTHIGLLAILFLGLLVPELFRKLKLPFITSLILIGAIFGPYGLDYIQTNETLEFFGFLGSAFLMLMAGLEVESGRFKHMRKRVFIMAGANGIIPFLVGVFIVKGFGYGWFPAIVVGTVFISSSIAIIASAIRHADLDTTEIGRTVIAATVLTDITSLFLLSALLQKVSQISRFPLLIHLGILVASIVILKMFLPEITSYFVRKHRVHAEYEENLRFVIAVLIAVLLYFEGLGVHPIVGAFVVGILLADTIKSPELSQKLHTIGYGLFVPVFFFIIGMQMDLSIFVSFDYRNMLLLALILGLIASKFGSGYLASRYVKFSKKESTIYGIATTAQLTTTLAATYAASTAGILDNNLVTAIIVLSMVTTLLAPVLVEVLASHKRGMRAHA